MSQGNQVVWLSLPATAMIEHLMHWGFLPEESLATGRDYQVMRTLEGRFLVAYDAANRGYRLTNFARTVPMRKRWGRIKIQRKYYTGGRVDAT